MGKELAINEFYDEFNSDEVKSNVETDNKYDSNHVNAQPSEEKKTVEVNRDLRLINSYFKVPIFQKHRFESNIKYHFLPSNLYPDINSVDF